MSKAHPGTLHEYAPRLVAFEFTSTTPTKQHSLIFIGGLTDGLCTVPYVTALANALEPTAWSVFQAQLSSSFTGWGTGSLDQDVAEIAQCVDYARSLRASPGLVVLMGHSTGSQDVLHYLTSLGARAAVDGAILQAPVSDREVMIAETRKPGAVGDEARGALVQLVAQARRAAVSREYDALLPLNLSRKVGLPPDPISARRFFSLASPDSPADPAEDDLFSSDLSDQRLRETFGVVRIGRLRSKLLVLYSGSDEFAAPWVDKAALMERWREATEAGEAGTWDKNSGIIAGASHNVKDEGQAELVGRVSRYLEGLLTSMSST